ncbi:MAG: hypothetical protein HKN33_06075 [Pyrinomonadaceae bacterium]|nr:hypothetical protein [Pyrinomonadaceae bacterium]
MDPKAILKSFWLLLSVFRAVGVQALGIFLVSYAAGHLAVVFGVRGCASFGGFLNIYFLLFGFAGIAATFVSLYYILHPVVWMLTIDKRLAFSSIDVNLPFLSTQPIYIFLDAVFLIPAIVLFQAGRTETMCRFNFEWAFGWAFLTMTLLFPVCRVVSWFILNRRNEARVVNIPWLTLIMFWIIAVPFAVYASFSYVNSTVFPRLRVPVVNEKTFKGGLKQNPQFMTGIVRVQGHLVRGMAKCGLFGKDPDVNAYPSGTVLLDLGSGNGQIMVKANRSRMVALLQREAEREGANVFEAFGRLSSLPNPDKKLVCGVGKADTEQEGGLALLELELPGNE